MKISETDWNALSDYRESLEHYGVKGMKWGIRKDRDRSSGRKTSKKAVAKTQERLARLEKKRQARAKRRAEAAAKDAEKSAAKAKAQHEKNLRTASSLYKHRNEYTQDEINNALKKFEWEKKLRDYSKSELDAGKKYLDAAFNYTNSAINLYNNAARVVNSFNLSDKPWQYIKVADVKDEKKKGD